MDTTPTNTALAIAAKYPQYVGHARLCQAVWLCMLIGQIILRGEDRWGKQPEQVRIRLGPTYFLLSRDFFNQHTEPIALHSLLYLTYEIMQYTTENSTFQPGHKLLLS